MDLQTLTDRPEDTVEDNVPRSRKVRNTHEKTYLWERVPRQLLDDARVKAKREHKSLKLVLVELLRDWTYGQVVDVEVQP